MWMRPSGPDVRKAPAGLSGEAATVSGVLAIAGAIPR